MVIGLRDPVLAPRDGGLQQVSHISLTEGEAPTFTYSWAAGTSSRKQIVAVM
jgi:hypothetical protein